MAYTIKTFYTYLILGREERRRTIVWSDDKTVKPGVYKNVQRNRNRSRW